MFFLWKNSDNSMNVKRTFMKDDKIKQMLMAHVIQINSVVEFVGTTRLGNK